jgi:hypothetical protein
MTGKNRIMIVGPKDDGAYVVEFRTSQGQTLTISVPRSRCWSIFAPACPTAYSFPRPMVVGPKKSEPADRNGPPCFCIAKGCRRTKSRRHRGVSDG